MERRQHQADTRLIDESNAEGFDDKLVKCSEEWKNRHSEGQPFLGHFIKRNKADIIITRTMTAEIRSMAALGFQIGE